MLKRKNKNLKKSYKGLIWEKERVLMNQKYIPNSIVIRIYWIISQIPSWQKNNMKIWSQRLLKLNLNKVKNDSSILKNYKSIGKKKKKIKSSNYKKGYSHKNSSENNKFRRKWSYGKKWMKNYKIYRLEITKN